MLAYIRRLQEVRRQDDGASAVEYGLLIAAVAALIVAAVFLLGNVVNDVFNDTTDNLCEDGSVTSESCP